MNAKDFVQFKKERKLGDIITDSFKFIRLEWKGFFWMMLKNSIIPFIFFLIAFIFFFNSFFPTGDADSYYYTPSGFNSVSVIYILIMMVSGVLSYVLIHLSALFYIQQYVENDGNIHVEGLWQFIQEKFWSFLGLSILVIIGFVLSALLCFLPLIYTWPILTLMPVIFIFSKQGALDTFGFSWNFVSGKHWADTWGIMFVVSLLVGVLGYVFSIPAFVYQIVEMMSGIENNNPTGGVLEMFTNPVYIALLLFSYLGRFLLYGITLVSNVLIYYDIDEQKNATGTIEQIENLGS